MNTDTIASTHLGKKSLGSDTYNPSLLVAVPRAENREKYGISGKWKVESGKFDMNSGTNSLSLRERVGMRGFLSLRGAMSSFATKQSTFLSGLPRKFCEFSRNDDLFIL